ncbi:MAG: hypothetical protein D6677_08405 [Calditrichaeota bacterium]|nr:MAG: hypothetical protein D6677_08405 [Calditrichota bacterium]
MATKSGKGSPLFILLIVLLSAALIIVLTVPTQIWEKEKLDKEQAQYNMSSIYEAEKFYHRFTKHYTTEPDTLLSFLAKDSTLKHAEKLVRYTNELRDLVDEYMNIPFVKSLLAISQNINSITEDLENNKRYFKMNGDILNEADQLNLSLQVFHNDIKLPNFVSVVTTLDSIYQLRRDLSDYNLQTAATMFSQMTQSVNTGLSNVEMDNFNEQWGPLTARIETFAKTVINSPISKVTSTGDRIRDFNGTVNKNLDIISRTDINANVSHANDVQTRLENAYQTYLKDFIVTNRTAQYRLAEQDSQVLYLKKENFFSPVNQQPYLLMIDADSADVKVESPVLLEDLQNMVRPVADEVKGLTFTAPFGAYADSLKSIMNKALGIKKKIRRNIDITIKNKELEEVVGKYNNSSEYGAFGNLKHFVDVAGRSNSFSDITTASEDGRNALSIFRQLYGDKLFNNIDSIHTQIRGHLEEYNAILGRIRRLPRGVTNFEKDLAGLDALVEQMKSAQSSVDLNQLDQLQKKLEEAIIFSKEGKTLPVYGIFETTIKNFGYIYKNVKSWEEEN